MSENIWKFMKENKIETGNEIKKDLMCTICNELMIKASNAPCGCRFCFDCIGNYLGENEQFCPGKSKWCKKQMINYSDNILIDCPINKMISELVVKCPRKYCLFKDELCLIENHMSLCEKRPISCPFSELGCEINEVVNDEMNDHLNEHGYWHSRLLIDSFNNFHSEMESMKNEIIELKTENNGLKQQLDDIKLQSTNQQKKISELENIENTMTSEITILNKEVVAIKNENRSLRMKVEKNAESLNEARQIIGEFQTKSQQQTEELNRYYQGQKEENNEIELLRRKINEICKQNLDLVSRLDNLDGEFKEIIDKNINEEIFEEFQWKVEKLSQQNRETEIFSKPFYSDKSGYKMCLSETIWDDLLYVYFHLMRGDSDDKLEWPFKYDVKIDVIDQQDSTIYTSQIISYSNRPTHLGWNKPSNDRNRGILLLKLPINSPAISSDQMITKCILARTN